MVPHAYCLGPEDDDRDEFHITVEMTLVVAVISLVCVTFVIIVELMIAIYAGSNYWHAFTYVVFKQRTWHRYVRGLELYGTSWFTTFINHFWL